MIGRKLTLGDALEIGCWSVGACLLVLYFGARAHGEAERRAAVEQFERIVAEEPRAAVAADSDPVRLPDPVSRLHSPGDAVPSADGQPDTTHWSQSRIRAWQAVATDPSAADELPAAVLRIPGAGLEVPVYDDVGERNLNRGAGLIGGTALPGTGGNVAIAAHRDGYFRALEGVRIGDLLELRSLSGRRTYRISELHVVEPTELWPLDETPEPAVTLVTCYPFYFVGSAPQRYIVRAVAVDAS